MFGPFIDVLLAEAIEQVQINEDGKIDRGGVA